MGTSAVAIACPTVSPTPRTMRKFPFGQKHLLFPKGNTKPYSCAHALMVASNAQSIGMTLFRY